MGHKFAFVIAGLRGHLYSCLPLIEELHGRGHELHFLLRHPDDHAHELLAKYGSVERVAEGKLELPPGSTGLSSFEGRIARFRSMLIDNERVDATIDFIARTSPVAVIGDASLWDTIIASSKLELPFIAIHTSIGALAPASVECERRRIDAALSEERAGIFTKRNVKVTEFRRFEAISEFLNIVWSVPELLHDPSDCPLSTELVGASFLKQARGGRVADWQALADKPIVYVSFGTIYHARSALIEEILMGLASLDVHVVLGAPALPDELVAKLPANCTWLPNADQIAVLEHSALFITHGGHASFLEAMRLGVSMLTIPLASDQPIQAFFVEYHGVGVSIPPEEVDAAKITSAVRGMLASDSLKKNSAKFSKMYSARGGAPAAVQLIEDRLRLQHERIK